MKFRNKRQVDIYLMVGAILLLIVGLPVALWGANSFNSFLSGTATYTQVENVTAFYEGPLVNGKTTEGKYASVNNSVITAEVPTWDTVAEWDQVVLTTEGTDAKMIFNWNTTVTQLLKSKDYQLRIKTNGSKPLVITINAVKFDGVSLTSALCKQFTHIGNLSQTVYWNWTGTDLLGVISTLNPVTTDEVYIQIIIEGYGTSKLTTGDTIQFQFALTSPSNAYSFTNWQIMTGFATIGGITFFFIAMASTSYWNPLTGNSKTRRAYNKVKRSVKGRKKKSRSKKRRK